MHNIDQLKNERYEFIISDRHGEDAAMDILKQRYSQDNRFRFFSSSDKAGWTVHYNDLLNKARGKYFCWVPHDDEYTEGYFKVLVDLLERNGNSVLSFGKMNLRGSHWHPDYSLFHGKPGYPFPAMYYIRLLNSEMLGIPFRGIFNRKHIVKYKLFLEEKRVQSFQDQYWIFEVMLSGDFQFDQETFCIKNYEKSSAHAHWLRTPLMKRSADHRKKILSSILSSRLSLIRKAELFAVIWAIWIRMKNS